jgi:hypothetical protein
VASGIQKDCRIEVLSGVCGKRLKRGQNGYRTGQSCTVNVTVGAGAHWQNDLGAHLGRVDDEGQVVGTHLMLEYYTNPLSSTLYKIRLKV